MTGLRVLVALAILSIAWTPPAAALQAPPPTPEQIATYETFRAWVTSQSDLAGAPDDVVHKRYAAELIKQGRTPAQAEATIALLKQLADRAESVG